MGVCRREIKKIRAFSSCGIRALENAFSMHFYFFLEYIK
ncbi:hypothetical protein B4116_0452 [Bacillus cereus]|nr:hypothetical protein B4085_0553 [Bacillus cereus]KZD68787.1 hypothetical protein B4116_0452 [Bacillus cereus]